jgi:GGDEF domain-containing protein
VQGAIEGSRDGERRRQFRPVDRLFDQLAAETVGAGQPASVIVVAVDPAALGPGLLYAWLVRIREQLRAGDFAGILSNTEIAVLLSDASAAQAAAVALRLKQLLQSEDSGALLLNPVFRTTTWLPEAAFEGSLVGAARGGAASVH